MKYRLTFPAAFAWLSAVVLLLSSMVYSKNLVAADNYTVVSTDKFIWKKLQKGGYVILMRHALTERTGNALLSGTTSCKGQQLLSDRGRKQAERVGKQFKKHKIPVGEVLTSNFCRTLETGKIIFGRATVLPALNLSRGRSKKQNEKNLADLKNRIQRYYGKENLVLISHRPNIENLTFEEIPRGGFLVLKPDPKSGFEIVTQVAIKPVKLTKAQSNTKDLIDHIRAQLSQVHNWVQLALIIIVMTGTWLLSRHLNKRLSEKYKTGLLSRLFTPAIGLCLLLITHGILVSIKYHDELVRLAIPITLALILIRSTVYLLRISTPKAKTLRAWEGVIATLVWIGVALYIAGWLPATLDAFNAIGFTMGGKKITLLFIFKIVASLVFFLLLASWLSLLLERQMVRRTNMTARIRLAISKSLRVVLVTLAVIIALDTIGVDITALTVLGGALGVGIGFGLQRIASNFVSGFILLFDRSIRPGDVITIGNSFGWIQELRARYVVIRDRDGVETLIPNENLITSQVINWSYSDKQVRQKLSLSVSYNDDPELAMEIMTEAARVDERVLKEPEPVCRLMEFADHGIRLELRYWIADPESGVANIRSNIAIQVWRQFKEKGITIPYPQRDLHIKDDSIQIKVVEKPPE